MSDCMALKVHDAQVDISNGILTAEYSFLRLTIHAATQVNFTGTPVSGYGSENLNVTQMVNFATDSNNNVFLTNATVTFTADNIYFDLQYLDTDGQEYLEDNKDYFINLLQPNLCRMLSGILTSPIVAIDNINVTQTFNFANDSVGHVFLLDATCTYNADNDNIEFDLKNLDTDASQYLEDHHDYFTELFRPQLQRTFSAILTSPIAAIFELVRIDDIFNFNC
ncbi:hypothetical protein CBL_09597 [Carabus blaptoides fortunei]